MPYITNHLTNNVIGQTAQKSINQADQVNKRTFQNVLSNAIEHINKVEQDASREMEKVAMNKTVDLHNVMISAQKASVTIEVAANIQQKAIDAYNEMMRMQV